MQKYFLLLFFLATFSISWGQDSQQEKLEKRKTEIQQEILENEKLLQSVKKKEKSAINIIILQNNKIKLKEKLIYTNEKQARILSDGIYINQLKINKLNRDLTALKEDYAKMIIKSYKSRSEQSRAMFLLSSENFLQAYKRAQYMQQYANYRRMQGEEIQSKTRELRDLNESLSVQKEAKKKLIAENNQEKSSLEKEKKTQLKLINSIKKDKKKIIASIKKKQQESRTIDRQINRLIREAIAEANRKAAGANVPAYSSSKIVLTGEAKILAENFKANKGKLPWPVEKGFVSLAYGEQPHPLYPSLVVHNSGVEITTDQGATARAVFGGEVTSVIVLSPVNKAVMIQHGDCFTVYQNLSNVFVNKGDKINIKQSLGKIRTNSEGRTVLKFTISQNTTYENPASWLYNM